MADITWRTTRLPDAIIGVPYEASLAVTGNATAFTAVSASPSLPTGLSFSGDRVRITGTPLKAAVGTWSGKITLTDTAGAVQSGTLVLVVRYESNADTAGIDALGQKVAADIERLWPQ